MTGQLPLFTVPPTGNLTTRQRTVLELVRAEPLTTLEAGVVLHAQCRYCEPGRPCRYAASAGNEVLRALRRRGLVRYRRGRGVWQAAGVVDGGHDPSTAPWPEGF